MAKRTDVGSAGLPPRLDEWCAEAYPATFSAVRALVRSDAAAEEIAQDALVRAIERWESVRAMDNSIGWAVRVGINLARSRFRRIGAETRAYVRWRSRELSSPMAPTTLQPDEVSEAWKAIRDLPHRQRVAVVLTIVNDRPLADVAAELECSYSSAREHARRGRRSLAADLAHLGGEDR